jgi:hypothetical protein
MRVSAIFSLFLPLVAQVVLADATQPQVVVDLRASEPEIRAKLLKHTPVGSSIGNVVEFISKHLKGVQGAPAIAVRPAKDASISRGAKTISVYLGEYYKHLGALFLTAPMIVREEVRARWWFDRHDRLIDIVVEKHTRVY